jgi:hypothetical protein
MVIEIGSKAMAVNKDSCNFIFHLGCGSTISHPTVNDGLPVNSTITTTNYLI